MPVGWRAIRGTATVGDDPMAFRGGLSGGRRDRGCRLAGRAWCLSRRSSRLRESVEDYEKMPREAENTGEPRLREITRNSEKLAKVRTSNVCVAHVLRRATTRRVDLCASRTLTAPSFYLRSSATSADRSSAVFSVFLSASFAVRSSSLPPLCVRLPTSTRWIP